MRCSKKIGKILNSDYSAFAERKFKNFASPYPVNRKWHFKSKSANEKNQVD